MGLEELQSRVASIAADLNATLIDAGGLSLDDRRRAVLEIRIGLMRGIVELAGLARELGGWDKAPPCKVLLLPGGKQ